MPSRAHVGKQQVQQTECGAHFLLKMRVRVLVRNSGLDALFQEWYPEFRSTTESERLA